MLKSGQGQGLVEKRVQRRLTEVQSRRESLPGVTAGYPKKGDTGACWYAVRLWRESLPLWVQVPGGHGIPAAQNVEPGFGLLFWPVFKATELLALPQGRPQMGSAPC